MRDARHPTSPSTNQWTRRTANLKRRGNVEPIWQRNGRDPSPHIQTIEGCQVGKRERNCAVLPSPVAPLHSYAGFTVQGPDGGWVLRTRSSTLVRDPPARALVDAGHAALCVTLRRALSVAFGHIVVSVDSPQGQGPDGPWTSSSSNLTRCVDRNRAENARGPAPNPLQNGALGPSFRGPEGSGGTSKLDLETDPVPEPLGEVSAAPFFAIFGKNGAKMGTPKNSKIANRVFLRWPKTASRAENTKKTGSKKDPFSGPVLEPILDGCWKENE